MHNQRLSSWIARVPFDIVCRRASKKDFMAREPSILLGTSRCTTRCVRRSAVNSIRRRFLMTIGDGNDFEETEKIESMHLGMLGENL
jgi:hypothetical protein